MTPPRPLARDRLADGGAPIVVARYPQGDRQHAPSRIPVTHSEAVLGFFTGGTSRMEQNGRWDLTEGDVLLIPAGQPHRMIDLQRPEYWGLSFCVPCFAADGAASLLEPFERVRDGASAVVRVEADRRAYLETLFRELQTLGSGAVPSAPDARAAVQRSLLTLILNEVARAASATAYVPSAGGGGVVIDALRFIERHCLRRLTLNDIAHALGRSPAYVTNALSRATGRSAVEWIITGRMAEARRLLLHSDERIDIVAERIGYADATHFIRMFRRAHGETPASWRAARRTRTEPPLTPRPAPR